MPKTKIEATVNRLKHTKTTTGGTYQSIVYPECGCKMLGIAPLPKDCPTHGKQQEVPDTLVSVVLDESGSMSSYRDTTISAYNEYIGGLRKESKGKVYVTLSKFDIKTDPAIPPCRVEYKNEPLATVPPLTKENYVPCGSTPLYDAIATTIAALDTGVKGRNVVMIILTDGEENSSREYSRRSGGAEKIKQMIAEREKSGWVFVYLGANQDAWLAGSAFGIHESNAASYGMNNVGVVMSNVARSTSSYTASGFTERSSRMRSFFDDGSGISKDNLEQEHNCLFPSGTYTTTGSNLGPAELGSLGGLASSSSLSPEELIERAQKAAHARWDKSKKDKN